VIELRRDGRRPLLIGHRGAATLARENTLAAIEAAARHGVDGVEVDLMRARDGRVVLAHGPEIGPDAPALAEALALVAELGIFVQLDVKRTGLARDTARAVDDAGLGGRSFVSSFSPAILGEFRAAAPSLPRSFTYPEDRYGVTGRALLRPFVRPALATLRAALPRRLAGWLRRADASALTLNWSVVTPAAIETAHALGAAVLAWTVNDPGLAEILGQRGIDAIITDDPRIALGGTEHT
jgi:glycerophosphoryl diester phosphodiesterase